MLCLEDHLAGAFVAHKELKAGGPRRDLHLDEPPAYFLPKRQGYESLDDQSTRQRRMQNVKALLRPGHNHEKQLRQRD